MCKNKNVLFFLSIIFCGHGFAQDANNDGYHDGDVAALKAIKENNGRNNKISWTGDNYGDWTGVTWSEESAKRVTILRFYRDALAGNLGVSSLNSLEKLECNYSELNSLDVSKNSALTYLNCEDNKLKSLDVVNNSNFIIAHWAGKKQFLG